MPSSRGAFPPRDGTLVSYLTLSMPPALASGVFITSTTWGWKILFPLCLVLPGSGGLSTCAHLLHPYLGPSCQYGPHRSREHGCFCFHGQSRNHASQESVHVIALSLHGLKNCHRQSIGNPDFLEPCSSLLPLLLRWGEREKKEGIRWRVCPMILCDPMDSNTPGSSVHGIFQARILKWVAISCCRGSSPPGDWTCLSWIGRWILCYLGGPG